MSGPEKEATPGLSTRAVTGPGAGARQWLGVLHAIYGARSNWRAVARDVVAGRQKWDALLVDLREHGESRGFSPPHTLERTAADLVALDPPGRMSALLGHSFGGKVALLRGRDDPAVEQVWVVDSTPAASSPTGSAWAVLEALRRLPERHPDRESGVAALEAEGLARPVALWMSANLERTGGGYRWGLDLEAMQALLEDFFRTDLWPLVEEPREGLALHFVRATDSRVLGHAEADRIRAAGLRTGRVFVHDVRGGHWLNADNPERLVELLAGHLPGAAGAARLD